MNGFSLPGAQVFVISNQEMQFRLTQSLLQHEFMAHTYRQQGIVLLPIAIPLVLVSA